MAIEMWSPNGDQQLALTSGHTFIVPGNPKGAPLPTIKTKEFQRVALQHGCLPVGMEPDAEEDEPTTANRKDRIKEKMRAMLTADDPSYFTNDGRPSQGQVSKMCGFNVDRHERDAVWKELESELDKEETA